MKLTPIGADRRALYDTAQSLDAFVHQAEVNRELWLSLRKRAEVPVGLIEQVASIPGRWHLLVLLEDWCGDAVSTIPHLARLADEVPGLCLRVLRRDAHPDVMDEHLTNGKRAIPIVMILDESFGEVAWWGPRPRTLQEWATTLGLSLPREERYRDLRRWYAADRGRTALDEVITLLCRAAGNPLTCRGRGAA